MQLVYDRSPTATRAVLSLSIAYCAKGMWVESRRVFEHCCSAECGRPWGSGAAGVRTDGAPGAQPRRCRRPFKRRATPLRAASRPCLLLASACTRSSLWALTRRTTALQHTPHWSLLQVTIILVSLSENCLHMYALGLTESMFFR